MNNDGLTLNQLAERNAVLVSKVEKLRTEREQLAAENVALKQAAEFATASDMWIEQADGMLDYRYHEWYVDVLKTAMETPATDRIYAGIKADAVKGIYSFNKVDCCVYLDGDVCMLIDAYEASLHGVSE